jgi:hypothetical protein
VAWSARISDADVVAPAALAVEATDVVAVGFVEPPDRLRRSLQDVGFVPIAVGVVLFAAVVLRFAARSPLWLDEAQTVSIARLPLSEIPNALRHDGAPPLYYALLHFWMLMFGEGTRAVRALSGLIGVAAIPVAWGVGRRLGNRATGWAAALLLATSPFAVRYSTENRMYALIVLLTLGGLLVVMRTLRQPTIGRAAAISGVTAALMLTHYWSLFMVVAAAVLIGLRVRQPDPERRGALYALGGVVVGALVFLPWLPSFTWQALHTATPWSVPPSFAAMASAVADYGGGDTSAGWMLGIAMFFLVVLGGWGKPGVRNAAGPHQIVLELAPRPVARPIVSITFLTVGLSLLGALSSGSAIAPRYTSAIFALWIVLAALGLQALPPGRPRHWTMAVVVILGLVASVAVDLRSRTEAPRVAKILAARAQPGDVIAYCPDQLGPAVSRLLRGNVLEYTFPAWNTPNMVDWVDYKAHVHGTDPGVFASTLSTLAARNKVWLVWSDKYFSTSSACTSLRAKLAALRGGERVVSAPHGGGDERATVLEFSGELAPAGA